MGGKGEGGGASEGKEGGGGRAEGIVSQHVNKVDYFSPVIRRRSKKSSSNFYEIRGNKII